VSTLLVAAFLVTEFAIGRLPGIPVNDRAEAWIAIVHCLLLGALIGSYMSAGRLGRQSLAGLRANFPDEDEATLAHIPIPPGWLAMAAITGFVFIGLLTPYLTTPFPWLPSTWVPEVYWHRAIGPLVGMFAGLTLVAGTTESFRVSQAASRLERVDPFEPERFAPLARHGMANGLIAVVLTSIGALFLVDPGQIRAVGPVWAVMLPIMAAGIIVPVWGVRTRIRREKQREMAWALEGIRAARAQEPVDTRRLGDLSGYYDIVRDAPEWPFNQSALLRVGTYVLIPAGLWLAAIMLEAVLQSVVFGG